MPVSSNGLLEPFAGPLTSPFVVGNARAWHSRSGCCIGACMHAVMGTIGGHRRVGSGRGGPRGLSWPRTAVPTAASPQAPLWRTGGSCGAGREGGRPGEDRDCVAPARRGSPGAPRAPAATSSRLTCPCPSGRNPEGPVAADPERPPSSAETKAGACRGRLGWERPPSHRPERGSERDTRPAPCWPVQRRPWWQRAPGWASAAELVVSDGGAAVRPVVLGSCAGSVGPCRRRQPQAFSTAAATSANSAAAFATFRPG